MLSLANAGLADAQLGRGDARLALRFANNALQLSAGLENRMALGISCRTLGDVLLKLGDAAQAQAYYERGIPILEELHEEHDLTQARQGLAAATSRRPS
jgi:tetratricopeptide (TPR) repeat protein